MLGRELRMLAYLEEVDLAPDETAALASDQVENGVDEDAAGETELAREGTATDEL